MVVVIRTDDNSRALRQTILYIVVIVAVIIVIYLLWKYLIIPISKGTLFPLAKVSCTITPNTPTGLSASVAPNNRAIVLWTATANTDNYILYMGRAAGFSTSGAERAIKVIGNSVAVLNLLPVTYYFKVAAQNSCGTSGVSSEINITLTDFPASFKLCKMVDPNLCMIFQGENQLAGITSACSTGPCQFTHPGMTAIHSLTGNLCLFENVLGLTTVEEPVSSSQCVSPTAWNINLTTGRVTTTNNLCLGADSVESSIAYNTNCASIINPDDDRYSWTIQPTTN